MKHSSDIYGDDLSARDGGTPAIPAATVVLLRDAPALEVLLLHRTSKVAFGGMWVFPGGRIDPDDYPQTGDVDIAARQAAMRETREETGLDARPEEFVWFSHWTPPPSTPKRYATWFFAARADVHDVQVDGGEIQNHQWLGPGAALERHAAGEIDLAPPTWITLHQLSRFAGVDEALAELRGAPARYYETRLGTDANGIRIAMWHGDAGYDEWDPQVPGARHRLVMTPRDFRFEDSGR